MYYQSVIPIHTMSHYVVEIVSCYEPIVVQICLCEHFLVLLVCHVLPQVHTYSLQVQNSYLSTLVRIKCSKHFHYLSSRIFFAELGSCKSQELCKIYAP